jgi:hypothetical protein
MRQRSVRHNRAASVVDCVQQLNHVAPPQLAKGLRPNGRADILVEHSFHLIRTAQVLPHVALNVSVEHRVDGVRGGDALCLALGKWVAPGSNLAGPLLRQLSRLAWREAAVQTEAEPLLSSAAAVSQSITDATGR